MNECWEDENPEKSLKHHTLFCCWRARIYSKKH